MAVGFSSSGTLVGAALETVGYYYQSFVLDRFFEPLIGGGTIASSIGGLLFIFAAAFAVGEFVIRGKAKFGIWILFGPFLFFFFSAYRVDVPGSRWMFGDALRPTKPQAQLVSEVIQDAQIGHPGAAGELQTPKVAWVFAAFNNIISSINRELVSLITAQKENIDWGFLVNNEFIGSVALQDVGNPGLLQLMDIGLFRECRSVYKEAEKFIDKTRRHQVVKNARRVLDEHRRKVQIKDKQQAISLAGSENADALNYVVELRLTYPNLWSCMATSYQTQGSGLCSRGSNASEQPIYGYNLSAPLAEKDIVKEMLQARENPMSEEARSREYASKRKETRDMVFTCDEIWNFMFVGLHDEAINKTQVMENGTRLGDEEDEERLAALRRDWALSLGYRLPRAQFEDDENSPNYEADATTDADVKMLIYRALAKHLFVNRLGTGSSAAALASIASRGQRAMRTVAFGDRENAMVERANLRNRSWAERTGTMNLAATIPYYQGILLYILAFLYPFFSFLLVIPGKHSGFMMWFFLWIWVKSWDVGYAVGMVVDNLFFKIFTSSMSDVQYSLLRDPRGEALPALPNNPGLAMGLLEAADPTFNMTTYYVVIGVVISSVPLVSSFLILGGLRGGANFIAEGMKGYAKSFSSAAFKTSSQYGVSGWRLRGLERKYASAQEYWSSEDGQPIGYRSGRTFVNTSGSFSAIKNHFATAVSMGQRSSAARAPFRGGLSKNQLLSTLNTARGTAGAARGAASALQKGAGNGLNSPRVGKNARKQGVAHSRSGLPNKQAARVDAAQQFTGNALDGYSAAASGTGDIYSDAYGDQLMLEHKWAQLDAMLSEDAIQDMQMARVYDVFELPFMDFETDGNRIEFDVYLSSRRRFADQVNVAIQFAEDLGRAGAAAAEKNRKGRQAVKGDTRTRRRQEKQAAKNQFDNRLRAQGYPKPANIKGPTIPGPKGDESFVLRPNPNRGRGGGS